MELNVEVKPKLVYFMAPVTEFSPLVMEFFVSRFLKCLALFFDVVIVNSDCDYDEVCDQHHPDLTLFDGGIEFPHCHQDIKNTSSHPEVPKIGLLKSDVFSPSRSVFISEMEQWGVETFFTTGTTMGEYFPQICERLFYWPPFIDAEVFHDYNENKNIPVLLTGLSEGPSLQYAWRIKMKTLLMDHYPSFVVRHPAYREYGSVLQYYGESYARLMNASMVVPTCGSVAKVVVLKHLEIPAARSCLLTERTQSLETFGFVDMENCVFADESDVLDKLDHLFSNRGLLQTITDRGFELVHSRHTARQRPQLLHWLQLNKRLKPGQVIIQDGPLGELTISETSAAQSYHIVSDAEDRILLRDGDRDLLEGRYNEAEILYRKSHDYVTCMPEAQLRVGICRLYLGDAGGALSWITTPLTSELSYFDAPSPDPVEWGYFLIGLLCSGQVHQAVPFARAFAELSHPQLDTARWAVSVLSGEDIHVTDLNDCGRPVARPTIHNLPRRNFQESVADLRKMLAACQQRRYANQLDKFTSIEPLGRTEPKNEWRPSDSEVRASFCTLVPTLVNQADTRLITQLKRRVLPRAMSRVNGFLSNHPSVREKVKNLAVHYLKVQDW